MKNLIRWFIYFLPALAIEGICYLFAPVVALFVVTRPRKDVVKRLEKQTVEMPRDYLMKYVYWFQTHDNAVDEWWYGCYNEDHWFKFAREWTQQDYDNSKYIRYYCRVMWLWRNCAYGFHYALFSRPKEDAPIKQYTYGTEEKTFWYELNIYKYSFKLEAQIPLIVIPRYYSINVGWKAHKQVERLLYANRFIGFRKYEDK